MEMNEQYIECEVFKADDGQYCFKYPESEQKKYGVNFYMESFRLSEAVNIPGFVGAVWLCKSRISGKTYETQPLLAYEDKISEEFIKPLRVAFRAPTKKKEKEPLSFELNSGIPYLKEAADRALMGLPAKEKQRLIELLKEPPKCEDCMLSIIFEGDNYCKWYTHIDGRSVTLPSCRQARKEGYPDGKCFVKRERK